MGYWVVEQVRTTRSSVMYKNKFRMGDMILIRVLMITCEMFLRDHLKNTSSISLIGSDRGRVDGIGDAI